MRTEGSYYDLGMLPLLRFDDPTLPIWAANDKWRESLRIVKAMRSDAKGLELKMALDTLIYHCLVALRQIESFRYTGRSAMEDVGAVEGLASVKADFLAALAKAKAVSASPLYGYLGNFGVDTTQQILDLTAPPSDTAVWGKVLVAGLIALAAYAVARP